MVLEFDGNAIVYCEGVFGTTYGKTAHGLVRYTQRYKILSVIDSHLAGKDAGEILDGKIKNIPIYDDIKSAVEGAKKNETPATHFVIGFATEGGGLPPEALNAIKEAIKIGLNIDSGLHDFLTESDELVSLAKQYGVHLRDVRKPPARESLHFFTGKIKEVKSLKVAMLGTDSAIGKRTTAWILVNALNKAGYSAEMIGTGQTAWMQGARYGLILDSLINDFVSGEIEHAVWSAWKDQQPDVIVIEGQGSLLNPAFPGGFEILASARPDLIILQHAPARKVYDGFPEFKMHPLEKQIQIIELISGKPVAAITINHEDIPAEKITDICKEIEKSVERPTVDVLIDGADKLVEVIKSYLDK